MSDLVHERPRRSGAHRRSRCEPLPSHSVATNEPGSASSRTRSSASGDVRAGTASSVPPSSYFAGYLVVTAGAAKSATISPTAEATRSAGPGRRARPRCRARPASIRALSSSRRARGTAGAGPRREQNRISMPNRTTRGEAPAGRGTDAVIVGVLDQVAVAEGRVPGDGIPRSRRTAQPPHAPCRAPMRRHQLRRQDSCRAE